MTRAALENDKEHKRPLKNVRWQSYQRIKVASVEAASQESGRSVQELWDLWQKHQIWRKDTEYLLNNISYGPTCDLSHNGNYNELLHFKHGNEAG